MDALGRTRLESFEGLLIPALWLAAIGVDEATDVPIIGWKTYAVAGTGVRFVDDDRPGARRHGTMP